ncbi:MAG: flagellar hook-basal body complex protein FliE [Lacunisphaera sp.]
MSPISSIPSALTGAHLNPLETAQKVRQAMPLPDGIQAAPQSGSFGTMLDGLVSNVSAKQTEAAELTKKVLLGDSDQLHQSVIAMQEAGVAFTLMVEVRNKLVESYQELMRMQV